MNIRRALISVYDKKGIVEFARRLAEKGVELVSTSGTFKLLKDAGLNVVSVAEYTGIDEILDGRVKTIHRKLMGGILADRDNEDHMQQISSREIPEIDMIVSNFCPFKRFAKTVYDEYELLSKIDIGGVNLIRAAAKNYRAVIPVVDPDDYQKINESIDLCGDLPLQERRKFALKAFHCTMKYEEGIHEALSFLFAEEKFDHLTLERIEEFDYGNNPHQEAYLTKQTGSASLFENLYFLKKQRFTLRLYKQIHFGLKFLNTITREGFVVMSNFKPLHFSFNFDDEVFLQSVRELHESNPLDNMAFLCKGEINRVMATSLMNMGFDVVIASSFSKEAESVLHDDNITIVARYTDFPVGDYDRFFLESELAFQKKNTLQSFGNINEEYRPDTGQPVEIEEITVLAQILQNLETHAIINMKDNRVLGMVSGEITVKEAFETLRNRLKPADKEMIRDGILSFDKIPSRTVLEQCFDLFGMRAVLLPMEDSLNNDLKDFFYKNSVSVYVYNKRHYS